MKLIDTHCHLYLQEFDQDRIEVIQRAEKEGVEKFFLPAIDSNETERLLATESEFRGRCMAMMGLHPCSVKENYQEELRMVEHWFENRKFAAVGEIGLDYYWDTSFKRQQQDAFEKQVVLAKKYQLPIVIHSRESMNDTIDMVAHHKGAVCGIFHCFSGNAEQARSIIDLGFYLGIGGVLTYKKSGLAEVLRDISLEHLVLETDAPYLTPVPFRGKRNESSYLKYIAEELARVKEVSVEDVASITTANAEKVFRSVGP